MNAKSYLEELEHEFVSTQNLLEILPENQLNFRPHEKAMSLGQLALHVATLTGRNLQFAEHGAVETSVIVQHPIPQSKSEILKSFEACKSGAKSSLSNLTESDLEGEWNLKRNGEVIASMPTRQFIRMFVLNHLYHHRGELTTYLRMLDQKIPSIYGPTADVNPFA